MERLDKVRAMECFGKMATYAELDPDPNSLEKQEEGYNCKECDSHKYCLKLAATL